MASRGRSGPSYSKDRYFQSDITSDSMLIAEGIEVMFHTVVRWPRLPTSSSAACARPCSTPEPRRFRNCRSAVHSSGSPPPV